MTEEPPWTTALDWIYDNTPVVELKERPENQFQARMQLREVLSEDAGMSDDNTSNAVRSLFFQGLIETVEIPMPNSAHDNDEQQMEHHIALTEKGFNIGHERRQNKKNGQIQESNARITGFLVLAVSVQAIGLALQQGGLSSALLAFLPLMVVLGVMAELSRSGMLEG